jgi:hypothetical protein
VKPGKRWRVIGRHHLDAEHVVLATNLECRSIPTN